MRNPVLDLQHAAAQAIKQLFDKEVVATDLTLQETKKEFEGDFTLVTFPLSRLRIGAPPQIAEAIGNQLVQDLAYVESYNVIKGFLNLKLTDAYWVGFLEEASTSSTFFQSEIGKGQSVVVEYCSPNTNKPLHLGHLRNIILGYSVNQILTAAGYETHPTCLFNDRGTNISKSMYAYLQAGKMDDPETAGVKGDKLVGDYYVSYAQLHKAEITRLMEEEGLDKEEAEKQAATTQAINEMTIKWEQGDEETVNLWKRMNSWVYAAYEDTFRELGVSFDRYFYESQVYQRGKETVEEGLASGVFFKDEDGAVKIDLTDEKLDTKVMLRANGTSLYVTQDLAIAADKYSDYKMDKSIYVVGNEQEYHFQVLFKVLEKLGKPYAKGLFHLSYGMVDLPSGKMKSREGTTVEADDLMAEMYQKVREESESLGKIDDLSEQERTELHRTLGLGALKYFLAKVDPKKRMLFDPKESIDLHGHTGPFIQYAYTRTASLQRRATDVAAFSGDNSLEQSLTADERILLRRLYKFQDTLTEAAENYNPALVANYVFELAKEFNRFYGGDKILQGEKPHTSSFRFTLSQFVGKAIKESLSLLGIEVPSRM